VAKWRYHIDIRGAIERAQDLDDFEAQKETIKKAIERGARSLPEEEAEEILEFGDRIGWAETVDEVDTELSDLFDWADENRVWTAGGRQSKHWTPGMGSLRDVPMPPNIERPEMWTTKAVVQAVRDGFTFLLPFVDMESMFDPNAYWIKGTQASANALTVGPQHTPEIEVIGDEWIRAKTFFPPFMVPEDAWAGPVNENNVVPVFVEIDPGTIDWELLNRGHQIRVRREGGPSMGAKKRRKKKVDPYKFHSYLDIHAWRKNSADPDGPVYEILVDDMIKLRGSASPHHWDPQIPSNYMDLLERGKAVLGLTFPQVESLECTENYAFRKLRDWGVDREYAADETNFKRFLSGYSGDRLVIPANTR
jgi:hypothetical protein